MIAVCKLSGDLFPDREASAMKVSVSIKIMNFVGCWFGATQVRHGPGRLARQYKFGDRSDCQYFFGNREVGSWIGVWKFVCEDFGSISDWDSWVLLLFTGIELAMTCRDMDTKEESFVMLVCAVISLTGSSAVLGLGEEGREQNDAVLFFFFVFFFFLNILILTRTF
jgi:hypothetical protein